MNRVRKIVSLVIFVPLAIMLIVLCVANREPVRLALNPFQPSDTVLSVTGPLFLMLFLALLVGMLIGAVGTWFAQGKYRKQARLEARAAIAREKQAVSAPVKAATNAVTLPGSRM
ncbi:YhcB family protein [Rhizobium lemnae]|uniref:YhcB family protein n=1 Tax=Rhizobium lemnae TaxID=1214924 RepID=A0ABV8E3N8_9HYPH|nr:YhcB family protein [Rhizobium lemnae]MCJ8508003.1 YhcB family protein [Rhizobium lemnae]